MVLNFATLARSSATRASVRSGPKSAEMSASSRSLQVSSSIVLRANIPRSAPERDQEEAMPQTYLPHARPRWQRPGYGEDVTTTINRANEMTIPGAWGRTARGAGLLGADGELRPTIFAEMSALAAHDRRDQPRTGLPRRGRPGRGARGRPAGDQRRRQPVPAGARHARAARGDRRAPAALLRHRASTPTARCS